MNSITLRSWLSKFSKIISIIDIRSRLSKKYLLFNFCITIGIVVIKLFIPASFKLIVDQIGNVEFGSANFLISILILYGMLWLADQVLAESRTIFLFRLEERYTQNATVKMFEAMMRLSIKHHLDTSTGSITSQIYKAQSGLQSICEGMFAYLIPTLIELFSVFILLTSLYKFSYSLPLLFVVCAFWVLNHFTAKHVIKFQQIYNEKSAKANSLLVDSLINFETVKYFNNEAHETKRIRSALLEQEKSGKRRIALSAFIQIGQIFLASVVFVYLTIKSGNEVLKNAISAGDFILINGYLLQFFYPLNYLASLLRYFIRGINDFFTAYETVFQPSDILSCPHPIELRMGEFSICFDRVGFSYDAKHPILRDVSFQLESGKTVAIVGPTGSGKSTLARLIYRLYDYSSGRILINNNEIRSISIKSLQERISVVSQETVLFNDSLYYNIAYGNLKASENSVLEAIRIANLEELVNRVGLSAQVGERGLKLSGGEKQRIAIARAILKKPSLFIFDEATSALDYLTEREIQLKIKEISKEVTTLVIAHRLSTVVDADHIIVLKNGSIVEQGHHTELILQNGLYAKLWDDQKHSAVTSCL